MQIQQMFQRDINRYINGVISVGEDSTVKQELEEYVVTRELQRHFDGFFTAYERGLDNPARNTGVWIQGYFGSGKSHFLKMLSYLLENRSVDGKLAIDYFKDKFDDPMTFAKIERAANQVAAETILFNIDEKGGGYKEGDTAETAVMRSIARVFYEHLGFYGRDYKLARFEKMIDDRGKTDEFREAYEDITGTPWVDDRESYDMFGEEVAQAANRAAGLSIQSITDWADSTDNVTVDFAELISDINEYAEKREKECGRKFRLLFMVDEMGQYLNGDVSRMLNLQTLVEQFCDKCSGRVWMVVTSQEAIDEMMSVVSMDFSKIQGRFSTRLALSSSSVDEVIKKRVLDKTPSAKIALQGEFQNKSAVLKNLFSFEDSRGDLRGYASETEFVESFPFVGYQFTLMPDVLKEIRKHGYQGKSLSTGERSMLSSYQEAAQKVESGEETSLVPFWRFFDTLEKELDHGIKQVFERCRRAAESDYVIQPQDIDVLKTLYLINYITDVKPTIGNIAILMIDDMNVDKIALREEVKASLDRLVRENYVARNGERYSFLTDEEQDVAREIRDIQVDPSQVIEEIKAIIFDSLYTSRKYTKGSNDFPFDRYVDGTIHGSSSNGMRLNVITLADAELAEATDGELALKSTDQALVVLDTESDYYDVLYNAARIKKYVQTQNVQALPKTKRDIIQAKQEEANTNRKEARELISQAIIKARVSVNGHDCKIPASTVKQKLDMVLDELVDSTFTKASYVDAPISNDGQLREILLGRDQQVLDGLAVPNAAARNEVDRFLDARDRTYQPTSMGDIQRHFQAKPFGWREIDVAAVVAALIADQKVMLSYGGVQVMPSDTRMKDFLRKGSEVDKATVKKRKEIDPTTVKVVKNILREIDSTMQVPSDEDGLVAAVKQCLTDRIDHYRGLLDSSYRHGNKYPGREQIETAISLANKVLGQKSDPEVFLREFMKNEDSILDNVEDLEAVERFFRTSQKQLFDDACTLLGTMKDEKAYIEGDRAVQDALADLKEIVGLEKPYDRIHELPGCCKAVEDVYGKLADAKRNDLLRQLSLSLDEIKGYADSETAGTPAEIDARSIVSAAGQDAIAKKDSIHAAKTCSRLDTLSSQISAWHEAQLKKIDAAIAEAKKPPVKPVDSGEPPVEPKPAPKTKVLNRSSVLPAKVLHNEAEVDEYVSALKDRLMAELANHDSVRVGN
jgi:hypothetical protein